MGTGLGRGAGSLLAIHDLYVIYTLTVRYLYMIYTRPDKIYAKNISLYANSLFTFFGRTVSFCRPTNVVEYLMSDVWKLPADIYIPSNRTFGVMRHIICFDLEIACYCSHAPVPSNDRFFLAESWWLDAWRNYHDSTSILQEPPTPLLNQVWGKD